MIASPLPHFAFLKCKLNAREYLKYCDWFLLTPCTRYEGNINRIEKDGFTGIHVGTKNPGIQDPDIEKAFNIIKSFD